MLPAIRDQVGARLHLPVAPGSDYPNIRRKRVEGEFKANLIVALAGGTVRDAKSPFLSRYFQLMLSDDGAGQRRAQQIITLVQGVCLDRREHVVADEFFAQVQNEALGSAQRFGL